VASKPDSQEICFVTRGSVAAFVASAAPARVRAGEVVSTRGEVLGRHDGIHGYTVGQRRGLGLGAGAPRYVVGLDAAAGRVVVGSADEASRAAFRIERVRWVSGRAPQGPLAVRVKVRHRQEPVAARVTPRGEGADVELAQAVRGVAPGQAAVLYLEDEVVGGGPIAA
jgi:tRNA-specific 2-thiouridylase